MKSRGGDFKPITYEWVDLCFVLYQTGQKRQLKGEWVKWVEQDESGPKSILVHTTL